MSIINLNQYFVGIGWALIHSLWQGPIILLGLYLLYTLKFKWNAKERYLAAVFSVFAMIICFVLTYTYYVYGGSYGEHLEQGMIMELNDSSQLVSQTFFGSINTWLNQNLLLLITSWIIGMLVFALRFSLGIFHLNKLKADRITILDPKVLTLFQSLSSKIDLKKSVSLFEHAKVNSPFTFGISKHVIYLPLSMINNLSIEETEAILTHELCHIKRQDFSVNILVSVAEIIFYFHPVMWWLTAIIKIEREEACDEMAVAITGSPIVYAKALLRIKELELNASPRLAMAFSNSNSHLLNRIKKVLNMPYTKVNLKEKLIVTFSILLLVLVVLKTDLIGKSTKAHEENLVQNYTVMSDIPEVDSLPISKRKESISIIKSDGQKDVELNMDNGEITKLKINGETIDPKDYDKHMDIIEDIKPSTKIGKGMFFGNDEGGKFKKFEFNFDDLGDRNFSFEFPEINHFDLDSIHGMFPNMDSTFSFNFFDSDHGGNVNELMERLQEQLGGMDMNIFPRGMKGFDWHGGDDSEDGFQFDHGIDLNEENKLEDVLGRQLNSDGFLIPGKENKVEITGKYLKINGEKQPENIYNKYKRIFEQETGIPLSKNSKLEFNVEGKEAKRKYRAF